ncbi:MAG: hypothetical protein U5N58_12400 [Actinomycetota bacterium]|nr:hypothetical protein [Actinomycetota bacterium]
MEEKQIIELSHKIRETVLPYFGKPESKRISGKAIGGDSTFFIDDISEQFLSNYLQNEAQGYSLLFRRPGTGRGGKTPGSAYN